MIKFADLRVGQLFRLPNQSDYYRRVDGLSRWSPNVIELNIGACNFSSDGSLHYRPMTYRRLGYPTAYNAIGKTVMAFDLDLDVVLVGEVYVVLRVGGSSEIFSDRESAVRAAVAETDDTWDVVSDVEYVKGDDEIRIEARPYEPSPQEFDR